MTPLRKRQSLEAELAGLHSLLQRTPEHRLATPMLRNRIASVEQSIRSLEEKPPLAPTAELFFRSGPALDSEGLEATFTSGVLSSYQNMVTNHYSAKNYGALRQAGRRRGERDAQLYLTALPRGSFGLQLSQPHVQDFTIAQNLSNAMLDISHLIEASVESDQAFEAAISTFNPRVVPPLKNFVSALHAGRGDLRLVTGFHETTLTPEQITLSYDRVLAAVTDEQYVTIPGVFGGMLTISWEFDLQPEQGDAIRGPVHEDVTEEMAIGWNLHLTGKRVLAKILETTVSTRTGKKKPSYELRDITPLEPPAGSLPPASSGPDTPESAEELTSKYFTRKLDI